MANDEAYRADAALVYRMIRDQGPVTVLNMALALFPSPDEGPASTIQYLKRRGVRRVLDAIVWMRHEGVVFTCQPAYGPGEMSTFVLGEAEINPLEVYRPGIPLKEFAAEGVADADREPDLPVTDKVSEPSDLMDLYHPV
jgi:hypothetical protein